MAIAKRARERKGLDPKPPSLLGSPEEPEGLPPVQISDVTTHPLGMIVLDRHHQERVLTLIKPSTPVPCERRKRFGYAYDNTTAVRVEVTEGAGQTRDDVTVIGEVILDNLPPRAKGTPLEVLYRYNVNQILEVYIIDVETGTRHHAQINLKGNIGGKKMADRKRQIAQMRVY